VDDLDAVAGGFAIAGSGHLERGEEPGIHQLAQHRTGRFAIREHREEFGGLRGGPGALGGDQVPEDLADKGCCSVPMRSRVASACWANAPDTPPRRS